MGEKLTPAQDRMLRWYRANGPTFQTFGHLNTWHALVRKGLLHRSGGLGPIVTEITDAGRAALHPSETAQRREADRG